MKKKSNPTSVGDILKTLSIQTKLGKHLEHAQIWEHWPELAGTLAPHGRPKSVKDGQLHIEAESAVWMHKFTFNRWALIKAINRFAGKELVHDIFVSLLGDDESLAPEKPE